MRLNDAVLGTFAQSNRGSVVRVRLSTRVRAAKRKAQQVLVPRCQLARWRASQCLWPRPPVSVPTLARQPVSVATPTGFSSHAGAPAPRWRASRCQRPRPPVSVGTPLQEHMEKH